MDNIPQEIEALVSRVASNFISSISQQDPTVSRDDLKQELYIIYLEKEHLYRNKDKFEAIWFTVFKNHLINMYNKVKKEETNINRYFVIDTCNELMEFDRELT